MSDMQSMDREKKKRQLRQNIVQMPDNGSEEPMDGGRLAKYKRKKRIIAAAAVCFLAALGFTGYRYMNECATQKTLARIRKHRQQRQVLRLTVQGQTEPVRLLRQKAPALPGREAEPQMRRRPRKLLHRQKRQKRSAIAAL